jgi:hypothetical protein
LSASFDAAAAAQSFDALRIAASSCARVSGGSAGAAGLAGSEAQLVAIKPAANNDTANVHNRFIW